MKSGIKSSEFWLALIAIGAPLIASAAGGIDESSWWAIPASALVAAVYATQRFLLKRQEAEGAANVQHQVNRAMATYGVPTIPGDDGKPGFVPLVKKPD